VKRARPAPEPARRRAIASSRGVPAPPRGPSRLPAAIYVRASTGKQSAENQWPDVHQLVRARGLLLVATYDETASSGKARPVFDRMLEDARRGVFSVLVVWALDRFGRSMVGNLQAVLELDRINVQVVSVREPWLDTGGPVRSLLVAIFSWVAEQERARLGERTRAGLDRARARGKKLGRPRRAIGKRDLARARAMLEVGSSVRFAAKTIKVPASTLHRALNGKEAT
jgi:putative DNA-invertase from lambdoid prophage Rac